jgi:hypothetical protein
MSGMREEMITGTQLQQQIIDLAHLYHWRVAHFRPALTAKGWRTPVSADGRGFPDLVMVRMPRVIIAEIKGRDVLTFEQKEWIAEFRQCPGVEIYVWKPQDWGEIEKVLK